ncbi:biotin holocarboxylase synthetase [Phlyctochytrium planicorne]|nr:biotin holocarboxylase synthetase [Phlyctochytrium planicorne]
MNVLIYNGSGTSKGSVESTIKALRESLSSSYDVMAVDANVLIKEPWQDSTSLLVMPGGRDLPYVEKLSPQETLKIRTWVQNGGRYLGICAGAYFACERVEFEVGRGGYEVKGSRDLSLVPGVAKGSCTPGFRYNDEGTACAVTLACGDGILGEKGGSNVTVCANGGPFFAIPETAASSDSNINIIARYQDGVVPEAFGKPAIVAKTFGKGHVVLSGPHVEFDPTAVGVEDSLAATLMKTNDTRKLLLKRLLSDLGLRLNVEPDDSESAEKTPSVAFLCTHSDADAADTWLKPFSVPGSKTTFAATDIVNDFTITSTDHDYNQPITTDSQNERLVRIRYYTNNQIPSPEKTPKFSMGDYFAYLEKARQQHDQSVWKFGSVLLYGETMHSTHTLLEKNSKVFGGAPEGLTCLASQQLAGRGRGRNSWISQDGCLQFSFSFTHRNPRTALFIQYLFALSVVDALRSQPGYEEAPFRIKWPNDIYAVVSASDGTKTYQKLGGILVTSSYESGVFNILIGCGLNVSNLRPTISINEILRSKPSTTHLKPFRTEQVLALVLSNFESMYRDFTKDDKGPFPFERFLPKYYKYWLHSGQKVTLEGQGAVTILGIDETGPLKAIDTKGDTYLLQPDGNSFDMMKGLLYKKQ